MRSQKHTCQKPINIYVEKLIIYTCNAREFKQNMKIKREGGEMRNLERTQRSQEHFTFLCTQNSAATTESGVSLSLYRNSKLGLRAFSIFLKCDLKKTF